MFIEKYKKIIGISLIILSLAVILLSVIFLVKKITFPGLILGLIFVLGILAISLGWLLILKPEFQLIKAIKSKKFEILLSIIILVACDFSLSFVMPHTYGISCKEGWCTKSGKFVNMIKDTPLITRTVTSTYNKNGFRVWGDLSDKTKKRVLVLGDSYTQDIFVNDGEEWYAHLEKAFPDTNFFVYGSTGYGSLQEYMILQDYINEINPDVIILQFCVNDYSDNYYPFNKYLWRGAPINIRPYLENNEIIYRASVPFLFLRQYSFTFDRLLAIYDNYSRIPSIYTLRSQVSPKILRASEIATEQIFKKIEALTVGKKVYMFDASIMGNEELKLCNIANINCIKDVWENVMKQDVASDPVRVVSDGHWNLKGNKLAGQELINYFTNNHALSN